MRLPSSRSSLINSLARFRFAIAAVSVISKQRRHGSTWYVFNCNRMYWLSPESFRDVPDKLINRSDIDESELLTVVAAYSSTEWITHRSTSGIKL